MRRRLYYRTILAVALVGLFLGLDKLSRGAAPEPAILQPPGLWTVEVTFEHPRQIVVGQGRFWYMIMNVTNRTGQDVEFYPHCELMTDTFQIVPAGRGVPPAVFQQIKQRHAATYPLLELLDRVDSHIFQGEDNAKDIAIIWRDFDLQAAGFKVFMSGLSNETAVVQHPVALDQFGRPVQIFLRKTLDLSYTLRGDPTIRSAVKTAYQGQDWVMR